MPFYEYVCTECGRPTEILQRLSDPPATECPSCHAQALVKQVSAAGFRLKGGGWYETDFKSGDKRNLATEPTETGAKSAAADAGHSCSAGCSHAPAAKAEPAASPAPAAATTSPSTPAS